MAKINSRKKGKRGERIAKEALEKWTGFKFSSVPQSGGLQWDNEFAIGDIICTDALHRFDFAVEVKNYKEINFEHLLMPQVDSVILTKFWPQTQAASTKGKKLPLLMMRYDGVRPAGFFFCVMAWPDFKKLKPYLNTKEPYFKFNKIVLMSSEVLFSADYIKIKSKTEKIIKSIWA